MLPAPAESRARGGLRRHHVRRLLGDAQMRQPAGAVVLLQRRDRGRERVEPALQLRRREPILSDGAFEATVDRLRIGSRRRPIALIRAHGREP